MLTTLLVLGILTPPAQAGTGPIIASPDHTVALERVVGTATTGAGLPIGAPIARAALDADDFQPICLDFSRVLYASETIGSITRLRLSEAAWAAGIEISEQPGFAPIIDEEGVKAIQVWLRSTTPESALFDNQGFLFAISAKVHCPQTGRDYERSGLVRGRSQ